jgi:3'-phosphoadenosine 5'-phosphosulfate sulfotransferase (PAPS reductase)/FAD synthetase
MIIDFLNTTKKQREELLKEDYSVRLEATKDCIKQVLAKAKNPIIQFSGGIDSCVMADIIHNINPKIPCLFNDWGIFTPEQKYFCIDFFNKYKYTYFISHSGVNWKEFVKEGFPIFKGIKFVDKEDYKKYNITEKCRSLKDKCWNNFYKQYKPDYYFVGMIHDESPQRKSLFLQYGFVIPKDKGTLVKPIVLLKKQEMFDYCKENDLLYPKDYYKDKYQGTEFEYKHCDLGCFMCGISFNKFGYGRLGRLARNKPELFKELLDSGLRKTLTDIGLKYSEGEFILHFLEEYDKPKIVAYDLDGVLCPMPKREIKYNEQHKQERDEYNKLKIEHFLTTKALRKPIGDWIIISGRREKFRTETETWLKNNNLTPKGIYLMEGALTFENIIKHKIKLLKEHKVERFYEDDPKLIREIKKALPNLEVIQIKRDKNNIKVLKCKGLEQTKLF